MPITKPNQVTVEVRRENRVSDGAGGYIDVQSWLVTCNDPVAGDRLSITLAGAQWSARLVASAGPGILPSVELYCGDEMMQGLFVGDALAEPMWSAVDIAKALATDGNAGLWADQFGLLCWIDGLNYSRDGSKVTIIGSSLAIAEQGSSFSEVWSDARALSARLVRRTASSSVGALADSPGTMTKDQVVLIFDAGTDVRVNDRCLVDSTLYTVQNIRLYSRSLQADVLAVT